MGMIPSYELRKEKFFISHNYLRTIAERHIHRELELMYMISGEQTISIADREYRVGPGQCVVLFPNIPHSYYLDKGESREGVEQVVALCSAEFYQEYFPDLEGKYAVNPVLPAEQVPEEVKEIMPRLKKDDSQAAQTGYLLIALARMLNAIAIENGKQETIDDLALRVTEYIQENYQKPVTLELLAQSFFVDQNTISRIFSKKLNMNLRQYLNLVRVQHAAQLIREGKRSIEAVGELAGFETQRTFNRAFQEVYHMTPSQFRDKIIV